MYLKINLIIMSVFYIAQENINRTFLRLVNRLSPGYSSPVGAGGDASTARKPTAAYSIGTGKEPVRAIIMPATTSISPQSTGLPLHGAVPAGGSSDIGGSYKFETYQPGEELRCVAAFVVDPSRFFLHKSTVVTSGDLDCLIDELTTEYAKLPPPRGAPSSIGDPCAALFAEDSRWYRAKLLSVTSSGARLRSIEFVDYGNMETVDEGSMHALRSRFFTLPVQAIQCRLAGVVPASAGLTEWSDDAAAFFEEVLGYSVHTVKVVSKDGAGVYTMEMGSVAQKLVDGGFAAWQKPDADGGFAALQRKPSTSTSTSAAAAPSGVFQRAVVDVGLAGSTSRRSETRRSPTSDRSSGFVEKKDLMAGAPEVPEVMEFGSLDISIDVSQKHSVVVSWVVSPSEFYVQLVDNCSVIEKLSRELRGSYGSTSRGNTALAASDCTPGKPCVAFYDADRSWYRGRIVSCTSGRVSVFYVDYGNAEVVPIAQVRRAQLQFMKSPPTQAVRCCLRGADDQPKWAKNEIKLFDAAVSVSGLQCRFVERLGQDVYVVELLDSIGCDLTAAKFRATSKPDVGVTKAASPLQPMVKASYIHDTGLKENEVVKLEVVHVIERSPIFNCHVIGQTDELDELMVDLATSCESLPALKSPPAVDEPCAALYSEDGGWYRAIVDCSVPAEHRAVVRFVDYGNTESCDVSSLRGLDAKFLGVPVRRVDAQLRGMTAKSLDDVTDDLLGQQFTATIVTVQRNTGVVTVDDLKYLETGETFRSSHKRLFATTESTVPAHSTVPPRSELPTSSLPTAKPPLEDVDVYVTHVNSPLDFYIQTADIEPTLTKLVDMLMEAYNGSTSQDPRMHLSKLAVGDICCARYATDGAWYRAVVESISSDEAVSVLFVDYGNSEVTSRAEIRQLTDQFWSIPVCAWHCKLSTYQSASWTEAQKQKFVDLTDAGEKSFICSFTSGFLQASPPYPVVLKDEGNVDMGQQLASIGQQPNPTGCRSCHSSSSSSDSSSNLVVSAMSSSAEDKVDEHWTVASLHCRTQVYW